MGLVMMMKTGSSCSRILSQTKTTQRSFMTNNKLRNFGILGGSSSKYPSSSSSLLFCQPNNNQDDSTSSTTTVKSKTELKYNTNEYLVQARIQARNEKNQVREKSKEIDRERNLRIKRLLHVDATSSSGENSDSNEQDGSVEFVIPKLYAIRVSVDKELRDELKLNGREKRGRMFIEEGTPGCDTVKGLKYEIHAFFRFLRKSTYLLSAGMPEIMEDGSIFSPGSEDDNEDSRTEKDEDPYKDFIPIENDNDVEKVFIKAKEYFEAHNSNLAEDAVNKRPSLLLHVRKDPNAPKPPPPPTYLENLANPKETETMTMLSFYSFPDGGIDDPEEFGLFLKKIWKPFDALGRVYVAEEGVNAQMSIPTNV